LRSKFKDNYSVITPLISFQLLWSTKRDILKNIHAAVLQNQNNAQKGEGQNKVFEFKDI